VEVLKLTVKNKKSRTRGGCMIADDIYFDLRNLAMQLRELQQKSKQLEIVVDTHGIECPRCGLEENLALVGALITSKGTNTGEDTGLFFYELNKERHRFRCPACNFEFVISYLGVKKNGNFMPGGSAMKIKSRIADKAKKIMMPVSIIVVVITLLALYYYLIYQFKEVEREREKKCYQNLTKIIKKSPKQRAEWIEKTIMAERTLLGGTNYCRALELVTTDDPEGGNSEKK
jgi:transposase-like protein